MHTVRAPAAGTVSARAAGARLASAAVAAAAAIRAGLDAEIEVPVLGAGVLLPSLGTAEHSASTAIVRAKEARSARDHLRVRAPPAAVEPGWRDAAVRRISRAGGVLVDDLDPFRMPTSGRPARPDGTRR